MADGNCIHLIRHGQYVRDPDRGDGALTPIGRRQARRTAARLIQGRVASLFSSDVQRASETAAIIARRVSGIPVTALPILREMLPTAVPGLHVPLESRRQAQRRIDDLIGRFLARPPRWGDTVVVCHGNLIRALLCRVLSMPKTRWRELGTLHCSITSFGFSDAGRIRLQCFNDSGHLPAELRTTM
jgi:serine/threonine-protein phosphatase PGAM5